MQGTKLHRMQARRYYNTLCAVYFICPFNNFLNPFTEIIDLTNGSFHKPSKKYILDKGPATLPI